MNLSENTQKADSAEDESWAEEHPEELLHAAIKLKRRGMIVHEVASLCYDATTCDCYAVKDEDGICSALSYDIETDGIIKSTTFEWTDKRDASFKQDTEADFRKRFDASRWKTPWVGGFSVVLKFLARSLWRTHPSRAVACLGAVSVGSRRRPSERSPSTPPRV